ncbi:MAG: prolipoprotein diacylglyceryl transferase, partial [Cytophagales bacterium]|nr:prolipoprotein diacylglyceryl transferase [Cytophagales bacterium]
MLSFLQYITWDVSPEILDTEYFSIRWYGLLFALGFLLGQQILIYIFKKEGKPASDVEVLTVYMVLSTIIGARLGHCLFYEPEYYLSNPLKILKIWEGGLASHGATIGILFALWLYARKKKDQSYLWVVDRIVITVALAGGLIRLGNLMNSEIIGKPTDVPWA